MPTPCSRRSRYAKSSTDCARNTTTRRTIATHGGWGREAPHSGPPTTVRYFGGTKLGVPGLIAAYRESAAEAIAAARIVERTVDRTIRVDFPYIAMNDIMRVIKEQQPKIASQEFDNLCTMVLTIRESRAGELTEKLKKAGGSIAGEDI